MSKLKPRIKCPICKKEWLWVEKYSYTATSIDIEEIPECRANDVMKGKFEDWYKSYPNKKAVGEARKAFKANIKTLEVYSKLVEGTTGLVNFFSRNGKKRKYIPHPSTFIRAESYLDPDYNKKKLDNTNETCYINNQDELVDYVCSKCKGVFKYVQDIEGKNYCSECAMDF